MKKFIKCTIARYTTDEKIDAFLEYLNNTDYGDLSYDDIQTSDNNFGYPDDYLGTVVKVGNTYYYLTTKSEVYRDAILPLTEQTLGYVVSWDNLFSDYYDNREGSQYYWIMLEAKKSRALARKLISIGYTGNSDIIDFMYTNISKLESLNNNAVKFLYAVDPKIIEEGVKDVILDDINHSDLTMYVPGGWDSEAVEIDDELYAIELDENMNENMM